MRANLKQVLTTSLCCFYLLASDTLLAHFSHGSERNSECSPRKYRTFNYPYAVPGGDTLLTGIRGTTSNPHIVYISGFYTCPDQPCHLSFVYEGTIKGEGTWNILNYPSSPGSTVSTTSLYGPNNGPGSNIQVVGNYTTEETGSSPIGCLYEGPLDGSGRWHQLIPTFPEPVFGTIAHSTMGGLVVGNYDTEMIEEGKAFIYDIEKEEYYKIIKSGAKSITAYGIWHNGGDSYTICGGYFDFKDGETAYLVDWDNKCRTLHNWRSYHYNNDPKRSLVTHFNGITSDGCGGYNLTGDWIGLGEEAKFGFFCHIGRHHPKCPKWSVISFSDQTVTSGNSVYQEIVIGVYFPGLDNSTNGYISIPCRGYTSADVQR